MLYICRKSYLTIHVVAPGIPERRAGTGASQRVWGGLGTCNPRQRGAQSEEGAGLGGSGLSTRSGRHRHAGR